MPSKKLASGGADKLIDSQDCCSIIKVDYLLKNLEGDNRPYLDVRIFGTKIRALLDSGASSSVLGQEGLELLKKFPARMISIKDKWVETADAKKHNIEGRMSVPITLEGRTKEIEVLVVPALRHTLILGVDFWTKMQLVADINNRTWEFSQTQTKLASMELQGGICSTEHLSKEQRSKVEALWKDHFANQGTALGRTNLVEHIIDTADASPIKQRYYPLSPARLKLVHEELDKMLKLGVVVPSKSPWSSPIILLDKPDGSKRFCIDFRKVNAVTKRDAYPLPKVTTILDRLRDARYLSSLDVKSAYWQIPLHKDSQEKTAFTIPNRGLFHFVTMPFGLHNAASTWQRFIDSVIGSDLEPQVFIYLDDIVVCTDSFELHLEVLKKIFQRLKLAGITLNQEKCCLCRAELKYLGYIVDERGLRVDPEKVEAIIQIPVPKTQKEVRQFCGTASWYRRFIPNFASRLYPLTNLLKKRQKFVWDEETQAAFEDIRSCLVKAPILTCPDFSQPFVVSCDASAVGLGAILSQERELGEQVIAYASRTLSRAEQKFSATERECLGVLWAIERFRPYIEGTHFTVITDHYSLLWLHNLKDPQGRLARWALRLQPYSFQLIHRKGKDHVVPDLLSRTTPPCTDLEILPHFGTSRPTNPTQDLVNEIVFSKEEEPRDDKWYFKMCKNVKENAGKYPLWKIEGEQLWKAVREAKGKRPEDCWRRVVPKGQRKKLCYQFHDKATAGHMGSKKTTLRIQEHYYWPKLRQDVAKYVANCIICQTTKDSNMKPAGMMGARRGVDKPWTMIAADIKGPFPRSTAGYKYLLVVSDTFTRFPLLFPLRSATAATVAKHLENDVFLLFGIPRYLIVDNGTEFTGKQVKDLAKEYKVKIMYNASRHPQPNPVERINKTIGNMLRAYIQENHRLWDKELPKLGFALRSARHEATNFTPAYLNFGRQMQVNVEGPENSQEIPTVENPENYGAKLQELNKIYQEVGQKLNLAYQKNANRYNLRRRPLEFQENDKVLRRNFPQSSAVKEFSAKLAPKFCGPFSISKKISKAIYQLRDEKGKSLGTWHISDLKPFIEAN